MRKLNIYILICILITLIASTILFYSIPRISYKKEIEYSSVANSYGSLRKVDIKEEYKGLVVESIAERAFQNQTKLECVKMPSTISYIGKLAFDNCKSLRALEISSNVLYPGQNLFRGCISLEEVIFRDDSITKEISGYMFYKCISLKRVNLPSKLEDISSYAFAGCIALESIYIPDCVKEIHNSVFYGCTSLKTIQVSNKTKLSSLWLEGTNNPEVIIY